MKPREMNKSSFWYGVLTHASFAGAYQDFLGKEQFIKVVEEGWYNTSPYMWVFFLFIALYFQSVNYYRAPEGK